MEGTELEEGEACSYQYDEHTNIDLDALTYIDEKIQNVLGHLKKDFEGGVTSENLGAKFGGYGSFLIQRSPVRSHSRSPAKFQDNHSHKSPTCLSAEGGNSSSLSRPNGNHSTKHGSGSVHSASSDFYKAPSEHDVVRQIARAPFKHSNEESVAKFGSVDKSTNMNEQKALKVRIKVGSDSLSSKKNTAIYSGLGLVSPSSSVGDSPIRSEELSQGLQFPGEESPTQIIRIMTSIPNYGGHLLSPLPEGLARLTEKLLQVNKVEPAFRQNRGNSIVGSSRKTAKILPVEDSLKSEERDQLSLKHKEDTEKALPDVNGILNNQSDLNTESCEVLVSEALKLPLLSDFSGSFGGKKGTSNQSSILLSNVMRLDPLIPILSSDGHEKQIGDENLAVKVADEEKVELQADVPSYLKRDGDSRGEAANSSTNIDANDFGSKSRKGSISGHSSSHKQKNGKKYAIVEQEEKKIPSGREQLPSGDKKKQRESHLIGSAAIDIHRGSIKNVISGNKDSSNAFGTFLKQKNITKAMETYKDLFGDIIEDGDDLMDSPDEPSSGRLKTSQTCDNDSKARLNNGVQEQLIMKVNSKRSSNFAPTSDHVPPFGDPAAAGAPVEDWVQCDKCTKWRLLPFGTKVDSLPENWLCSMLDWLPGMNSCSITEEETTKAVTGRFQPHNRNALHGSLDHVIPGATAASDLHLTQTRRDIVPSGGRKQHDLKEVPNSKQELLHSVKNTSLTNTVGSHLENELHFQHVRNPTDPVVETNLRKRKSKKKLRESYSDGGHSKDTSLGGQRDPNQDFARAKKMKTEDEAWISTDDIGSEMLIYNSSNELVANKAQKGLHTNHASSSSRSSKGHTDDILQDSIKKSKFQGQALPHVGCMDTRNFNDSNVDTKKRKVKSSIDAVSASILSDNMVNESEEMGLKKARLSLPEEKPSSSSQGKGRIDKGRKGSKDHRLGKDVGSTLILDDHGSLKRELGTGATSSSSKVLDIQKSKSFLQEVKSSTVESIYSSPFRNTNLDMFASGMKNLLDKDCSRIAGSETKDDHQSVHCLKDRLDGCLVDDKVQIKHSLDPSSGSLAGCQADDTLDQHNLCTSEAPADDGALNQSVRSVRTDNANGSLPKQSAKVSSWSKDKNQILKPTSDKGKMKICESYDDSRDHPHTIKDKTRDIKIKFQDKPGCSTGEMDVGGKNNPSGIMLDEASKENGKLKSMGQEDPVVREESTFNHEMGSIAKKTANTECGEKASKSVDQDKDEEMELDSGKKKSRNKSDWSNRMSLPCQGNGADASRADAHDRGKGMREQNSTKKPDIQNGMHSSTSKHQLSNVHRLKDRDTPSPMRRDSHNQAASNALKEAKDLKHLADRKKNSGSAESTGLYFEAVLKFLNGACLLESSGSENSKRGDIIQSMQVYSSTAKLCEFCAHEYEKSKDLASAALAYKCMEVAYLRVVYSSHAAASRDRHELQSTLQMAPPGESPSSSASDIDNASNPATTVEKAVQARDGNSPQPAGNHVIAARNRPIFSRLLNFMQDVNSALEASRKSQGAFAAAKAAMQQADSKEGITSIKRVLDFNFHDVNGLLRLARLAMEAIRH